MLLDDLVGVIETLKERIATHGASLRENETRTRMALIDPLLQTLGWDVSDPEMVTPEYSVGNSRADYALLMATGNPSALVEAKKLDESLASHRMQMLNYANISGIPHAGLTDGNHWEMYTVFDQAPIEQRRILDVSIASTPAHEAALKLLLLWRPNLASGRPVHANAPALANQGQSTITHPAMQPTPVPSGLTPVVEVAEPVSSVQGSLIWKPLSTVTYQVGDSKPIGIRFPDSQQIQIKRGWTDAWFQVCEWLASTGKLTEHDCPIRVSSRASRYLVNSVSTHSNNKPFGQPKTTTTGLFVERQFEPKKTLEYALFLLDKFGLSPETVELRFG